MAVFNQTCLIYFGFLHLSIIIIIRPLLAAPIFERRCTTSTLPNKNEVTFLVCSMLIDDTIYQIKTPLILLPWDAGILHQSLEDDSTQLERQFSDNEFMGLH